MRKRSDNFVQNANGLVDFRFSDDVGGQKAQDVLLRTVDEEPPVQRRLDERVPGFRKLDTEHHSFGPDFTDDGVALPETVEAQPESIGEFAELGQSLVQEVQEFQGHAAASGPPPKVEP